MAWVLLSDENEGQDKRVESASVPCLDAGSTPASSTKSVVPIIGPPKILIFGESGGPERLTLTTKSYGSPRVPNARGISSVGRAQRSQC